MHPSQDLLSAYLDGELAPAEAASVEQHATGCAACATSLERFSALDQLLTATPALTCDAALTLVSAGHDSELEGPDVAIATAHLDRCADCRARATAWTGLDGALAALPLFAPSAAVDAALERFRRAPVRIRRQPLFGAPAWPARAAAAVAVAMAVLIALPQAAPELALPETALVASVQQSVLYPPTSTLYVLRSQEGAVAALDAATFAPRAVISVGGKPTALALSARTDQILVLDASAKTLTAIDPVSNSVVGASTVAVPGTPTSLQVDAEGKVVVASIIGDTGGGAAPSPAHSASPATGAVTVIDPKTRLIETVSQVDVAPRQVVIDASGKRALLVSSQGTTIVDAATYKPLDRVAGGIAAAFSSVSDGFAILSLRDGAAFVTFSGRPGIALSGAPRGIAALPDGGYAVLTDQGGKGRVTALAADGSVRTEVGSAAGRDLTFDPVTGTLAVISPAGVSVVAVPGITAAARAPSPQPTIAVPASAAPIPAPFIALPSASPVAEASPGASTAPSPSPGASAPVVVAIPEPPVSKLAPTGARLLSGNTYLYAPEAARATRLAGDTKNIWMLDAYNRLTVLDTGTEEVRTLKSLPANAQISSMLVSPAYVYLVDPTAGSLYVMNVRADRLTSVSMPFLPLVVDAVTSPDDRLWLVVDGLGLVSFDPRSHRTEVTDVGGTRFTAVGIDAIGRVWLAPRDRGTLDVYDPYSGRLTQLALPHDGAISAIVVDARAAIWVGTDTGQIFTIRNGKLDQSGSVGRAIDRLVLGPSGDVWYVSGAGGDVTFGPADGTALALHGPRGMSTPVFDALGRAWAQDPGSGAFFVTVPPEGR